MERVGDIMERLGFNKEADDGVKAAFVKNLIKQAYGVEVSLPPQYEARSQPQTFEEYGPRIVEAVLAGKPLPHGRGEPETTTTTTTSSPTSASSRKPDFQQLSFDLDCETPKVG